MSTALPRATQRFEPVGDLIPINRILLGEVQETRGKTSIRALSRLAAATDDPGERRQTYEMIAKLQSQVTNSTPPIILEAGE